MEPTPERTKTGVTEAEWLACTEPLLMPKQFRGRLTVRKRCLLACAYALDAPGGLTTEVARHVVRAVQTAALTATTGQHCTAAVRAAVEPLLPNAPNLTRWNLWSQLHRHPEFGTEGGQLALFLSDCAFEPMSTGAVNSVATACLTTVRQAADRETAPRLAALFEKHKRTATAAFKEEVFALIPEPVRAAERGKPWVGNWVPTRVRNKVYAAVSRPRVAAASVALADLAREVLGNPFRSPKIEPAWRLWNHGAVWHIAERVAASGNFTDLPVLADALEDAGCSDEHLLAHCRAEKGHVHGCWALDAVLGRS